MYDKSVAIIGSTIEKTTKYDWFREDKIRMELYSVILALYGEGYRTFSCNLNTYIGLLAADTVIILRKADKCPDIRLSAIITGIRYPKDTDKVYCALYDDLIKQADSKETLPEKESFGNMLAGSHIVFVKVRIDLAGHGEPPQRVGPQIAQIGLRLTGRVVCAGQHHAAVSLQRVIQFHLIPVGIHELGCGHGRGHHAECKPQRQHKADKSVSFFHSFLPK